MAFTAITNEEIEVGKPVKKSLLRKVKDNLDDHETRINSVETFGNLIEIIDISPKDLGMEVGKTVAARMTLAEFQEVNGDNWYLADGGSAAGTYWNEITGQANFPDYRDQFLRGLPETGRTLGDTQDHAFQDHTHNVTYEDYGYNFGDNHYAQWNALPTAGNSGMLDHTYGSGELSGAAYADSSYDNEGAPGYQQGVATDLFLGINKLVTFTVLRYPDRVSRNAIEINTTLGVGAVDSHVIPTEVSNTGNSATETRPKNHSVNYFIKGDRDNLDKFVVYKTKQNITITDVRVEVIHQDGYSAPTGGTLEIDIRTGSNLASLSSIFNTKPNVTTFAEGDISGTPDIITTREDVDAGQYLVLDITSLQKGQSQIYITVLAEPR